MQLSIKSESVKRWHGRWGMALPTVLLLSTVMMMMIGTLFFRTRSQRTILPRINLQTKALALSKGVMQLALYKVKVLPAEFYRANALLKSSGVDPDDTENDINQFFAHWMSDFDDQIATSPVQQMIQRLPDRGKHTYRAGVAVFSIQKSKDAGFKKDLVRITSWASCDEEKKTFESLIEVDIPEITP